MALPRGVRLALKIAAWIGGVLALLVIALLIVLHSDWGRERVRAELQARLQAKLRGDIEIGRLSGSVLGSPSAESLVLRDQSGKVIASADAVDIDYSLLSLLGDDIGIESITLRRPVVRLDIGPDGRLAIADLWIAGPEKEPGGPPLRLGIDDMRILDGRVVVAPADGPVYTVEGLDARASDLRVVGSEVAVKLDELAGRWAEKGRPFALSGTLDSGEAGLVLDDLAARFGGSSVTDARAAIGPERETVDLAAELDLRAVDVNAIFPDAAWRGDFVGQVAAERPTAQAPVAVEVDARLAGAPLRLSARLFPETRSAEGEVELGTIDPSQVTAKAPPARVSADLDFRIDELDGLQSTGTLSGTVSGRYQGYRLERAALDLRLDRGKLSGELLVGPSEGGLTMSGGATIGDGGLRLDQLRVRGRVARIEDMVPKELGLSGAIRLDATVSGPLDALRATGTGRVEDLRFRNARVGRARVRFSLRGLPARPEGEVTVDARQVARGGQRLGRLHARAVLGDGGRSIDLRARGSRGELKLAIDARIRRDPAGTRVRLRRFSLDSPELRIASTGGSVAIGRGGAVRADDLAISAGRGRLRADGSLDRGLVLTGEALDLAQLGRALGIDGMPGGTLAFHAELGGRLDRLLGTVELEADGLVLRPNATPLSASAVLTARRDLASADVVARGADIGRVELELDASRPRDLLDLGTWRRRGIGSLRRVHAHVVDLQVSELYALLEKPAPVVGLVSGKLEIAERGRDASARLTLRDGAITAFEGARNLDAELRATLSDRRLDAEVSLRAGSRGVVALRASGTLPGPVDAPRTWRELGEDDLEGARLSVADLRLQELRDLVPAIGEMHGTVGLAIEVEPRARRATARLTAERLRAAADWRAIDAELEVELAERLVATLGARSEDVELLTGRAELPVSYARLRQQGLAPLRTAAVDARLESRGVPLSLPAELIDLDDAVRELSGEIEAVVEMKGRIDAPVVDLRADLVDARFDQIRFDSFGVRAHATGAGLEASARAKQEQGGSFFLGTKVDFSDLSALDLDLRARRFDLSFLAALDRAGTGPLAGLAGTFDAALRLRGSRAEPVPDGWVRLQGGRVRLRGGLQPLSDIRLVARADDQRLTAELEAHSGGGRTDVKLEAKLAGEPLRRIDGTIRVDDFPYAAGTSVASISGEAELTARRRPELWDVTVGIRDTLVRLPERQRREMHPLGALADVSFVEELSAGPDFGGEGGAPEPVARFRVIAPDSIQVRGDEVQATVDVDLVVTLTGAGPAVTGTVGVTRGRVVLFDRRYEVITAQAAFAGEMPPNPQLNVQLQHDFGELAVTINVTGTLDEPNLVLSSEPGIYDQATLLAIVLGRNPNRPDAGDTSLEGQALGVASGFLLGKVRGVMEEILPIDVLRLDTGDQEEGSRLTVGRWVTDDLFVAYRYRADGDELDNTNEAIIDYRFTNRWTLEGTYGDRGQGGLDILWVKRY